MSSCAVFVYEIFSFFLSTAAKRLAGFEHLVYSPVTQIFDFYIEIPTGTTSTVAYGILSTLHIILRHRIIEGMGGDTFTAVLPSSLCNGKTDTGCD